LSPKLNWDPFWVSACFSLSFWLLPSGTPLIVPLCWVDTGVLKSEFDVFIANLTPTPGMAGETLALVAVAGFRFRRDANWSVAPMEEPVIFCLSWGKWASGSSMGGDD